ncbi:receptor-type tyrosine-protein phosphatase gamma [Clarias magur]|uniref:Receptor-type tyrosine-protein phosphatase gamma n=1 Tax=Clarias magur TaxID=1594786 RepID=A0A8J4XFF0_CLAMG|nr:receptor-type tyrosine-protein phosphatase gamma [Clarias magur]
MEDKSHDERRGHSIMSAKFSSSLLLLPPRVRQSLRGPREWKCIYGPETGWASAYPECQERNQSPINIADQDTRVSPEYQELILDGFEAESSNKTSMKNTGKTGKLYSRAHASLFNPLAVTNTVKRRH